MASKKQILAARRNVKKAIAAAQRKHALRRLPKKTRIPWVSKGQKSGKEILDPEIYS